MLVPVRREPEDPGASTAPQGRAVHRVGVVRAGQLASTLGRAARPARIREARVAAPAQVREALPEPVE
jgi:hypothetical protein